MLTEKFEARHFTFLYIVGICGEGRKNFGSIGIIRDTFTRQKHRKKILIYEKYVPERTYFFLFERSMCIKNFLL
jgi:hypothetical protein